MWGISQELKQRRELWKKVLQTQLRLSKIAHISITETDAMDLLEERELVLLLVKDLNNENDNVNLDTLEMQDEHKKEDTGVYG
jgi:uncharacterized protein YlxP (DUF503 family)